MNERSIYKVFIPWAYQIFHAPLLHRLSPQQHSVVGVGLQTDQLRGIADRTVFPVVTLTSDCWGHQTGMLRSYLHFYLAVGGIWDRK